MQFTIVVAYVPILRKLQKPAVSQKLRNSEEIKIMKMHIMSSKREANIIIDSSTYNHQTHRQTPSIAYCSDQDPHLSPQDVDSLKCIS